jgi:hypothetical protein
MVKQFLPTNQRGLMFHRVVVNVADQFDHDNNGGFNLENFKPDLVTKESKDFILKDWSKSFMGQFTFNLSRAHKDNEQLRSQTNIEFSLLKFEDYNIFDYNDPETFTQERNILDPNFDKASNFSITSALKPVIFE